MNLDSRLNLLLTVVKRLVTPETEMAIDLVLKEAITQITLIAKIGRVE